MLEVGAYDVVDRGRPAYAMIPPVDALLPSYEILFFAASRA